MIPLYGYDGASPFNLSLARANHGIVCTGYIVGHPGGMNPVDKARVNLIRALGMGFLPNWERAANALVIGTRQDGHDAGVEALAACRALGVPDDGTVACAFSWDVDIDTRLYQHCGQVADGIIAGLAGHYRFTAYGQGGLIDHLVQTGRMTGGGWLSGSSSFPGFDPASPNVAMVQSHDVNGNWLNTPVFGTDINTVTRPHELAAWWPEGSEYGMTPADVVAELLKPDNLDKLATGIMRHPIDGANPPGTFAQYIRQIRYAQDPAKFAAAVLAKLPAGSSADQATIEAAMRAVFADLGTPGATA